MICLVSFSKFSVVFPAFTCASTIGILQSIFIGVSILIRLAKPEGRPLPFCCLLKLKIFSTILTTLIGFSFSGISFLLRTFIKTINPSLTY